MSAIEEEYQSGFRELRIPMWVYEYVRAVAKQAKALVTNPHVGL